MNRKVLKKISKSNYDEIVLARIWNDDGYKGIDMRIHSLSRLTGEGAPTKKGIAIPDRLFREFLESLQSIYAELSGEKSNEDDDVPF